MRVEFHHRLLRRGLPYYDTLIAGGSCGCKVNGCLVATGGVFFLILVLSILGCMWIPVNFKLEWFIPDDSYVNEFYQMNDQYFDQSLGINVYTRDIDYYAQQQGMSIV